MVALELKSPLSKIQSLGGFLKMSRETPRRRNQKAGRVKTVF